MAENTVEILIKARDEASKVVEQTAASMGRALPEAAARTSASLGMAGQRSQDFARAAQRASRDVLDWSFIMGSRLTPELSMASVTILQVTNAALEMGTKIGLVTGGIGLLVAGIVTFIAKQREATEAHKQFLSAMSATEVGKIDSAIQKLVTHLGDLEERARAPRGLKGKLDFSEDIEKAKKDLDALIEHRTRALARIAEIEEAKTAADRHAILVAADWKIALAESALALRHEGEELSESFSDLTRLNEKRREAVEILEHNLKLQEAIRIATRELSEIDREEDRGPVISPEIRQQEALQKRIDELRGEGLSHAEAVTRAFIEQEEKKREAILATAALIAKTSQDAGKQFSAGMTVGLAKLEEEVGTFGLRVASATQNIGHAMFQGMDETFFKVFTGRLKDLPKVMEEIGADILRSLIGVMTGPLKEQLLKTVKDLFKGGGAGFSGASPAAFLPGGLAGLEDTARSFSFLSQISSQGFGGAAAPGTIGAGGLNTLTGIGPSLLGGGLSVLGGLAGIAAATQAPTAGLGALTGGLGGLQLGMGLSMLGLGSFAVLGPIGLGIGALVGIFAGMSASRKRKRQEEEQRRIQEAIRWQQELQRQAQEAFTAVRQAGTIEELDALLARGFPETAFAGLGAVPGLLGAAGQKQLEEARQGVLQDFLTRRLQVAGPGILEEERGRLAGARTLPEIEALLARAVSPDIPGLLSLRGAAEQRRQELLGGLEALGGISMDEEIEGGIRRRTIVGAGPFGAARAAQMGREVTIDRSRFRRLLREQLFDSAEALEMLLRKLRAHAQAIDFRVDDLEALA